MVRVSERPVKNETLLKISNQLVTYISSIQTKSNAEKFLDELLSDPERIMLAKRLAIVVLLERGHSYKTIERTLKVSSNTIARISGEKDKGRYKFIAKSCSLKRSRSRREDSAFWDYIELVLLAGMPSMGRGRWKFLDDLEAYEKRRQRRKEHKK